MRLISKIIAAVLAVVLCAGLAGCKNSAPAAGTAVEAVYTAAPARDLNDVTVSHGSGFYAEDINLEIICPVD